MLLSRERPIRTAFPRSIKVQKDPLSVTRMIQTGEHNGIDFGKTDI